MDRFIVSQSGIAYQWDERKAARSLAKHGIAFEDVRFFEWNGATTFEDRRRDYGERRYISYGVIGYRLHVLIWTSRGEAIRVISLRKANAREFERYG